jgi:hypothetical protein
MVHTAGHGGVKLSRERQAKVPAYFRCEGGWYEEDCDANIPLLIFEQDIRQHGPQWLREALDKHPPAKSVMAYRPDEYERYTGHKVKLEESYVLRERAFRAAHANDWVVICAWGSWQPGVPKGMVGVCATIGEKRDPNVEHRCFLVDDAEYEARQGSFVIDLARHQQVEDFTKAEAATKRIA